jgi:tetratricopeptide (TPR) repeat protein
VQRLFDRLAARGEGLWSAGLAPSWPPRDATKLHYSRKQVTPTPGSWGLLPQFLWVGVRGDALATDASASVAAQVISQVHAAAAALPAERRREARSALGRLLPELGLDIFEELSGLSLPHAVVKRLMAVRQQFKDLLERNFRDRYLMELGRALVLALKEMRRLGWLPVCVVTLDDAHALDESLLRLLSILLGSDADLLGEDPDARSTANSVDKLVGEPAPSFLVSGREPAVPLLFVATAWPHRVAPGDRSPFTRWVAEARRFGYLTEVPLRDLPPASAQALIEPLSLPGDLQDRLLTHLTSRHRSVVPLVLAESAARLEEKRDGFTGRIDVDAGFMASLPTDPEFHLRDRLRLLTPAEQGLLTRLAIWSDRPPEVLPRLILESRGGSDDEAPAMLATLASQLFLSRAAARGADSTLPLVFEEIVLDNDVSQYLRNQAGPAARQDMKQVAVRALGCATEALKDEFLRGPIKRWTTLQPLLEPALRLVDPAELDGDVQVLAGNLAGSLVPQLPPSATAFGSMVWHAYLPDVALRTRAGAAIAALEQGMNNRWAATLGQRLARLKIQPDLLERIGIAVTRLASVAPDSPHAASALAAYHQAVGSWDRAIAALAPFALSQNAGRQLVGLYEEAGRLAEAEEALVRLAGRNEQAALQLADMLESQGRLDEAERWLTPLALSPNVAKRLAGLLAARGAFDEAMGVLTPLAENGEVAVRLAELLEGRGRRSEAEKLLAHRTVADPSVAMHLAGLQERLGRPEEAEKTLLRLATADGNVARALANFYERSGRPEEAERVLAPIAEVAASVTMHLAGLQERLGRLEEAEKTLLRLATVDGNVALALAKLFESNGRPEDAERLLASLASGDVHLALRLAALYKARGQLEKMEEILVPFAPTDEHAALRLADLYEEQEKPDAAEQVLTGVSSRSDNVIFKLADLYQASGRLDEAARLLTPLAQLNETAALALAAVYRERSRLEGAEQELAARAGDPHADQERAFLAAAAGSVGEAFTILAPHRASRQDAMQGAVAGVALLVDSPVPSHEPRTWTGAIAFVKTLGRFLSTDPARQPQRWGRFLEEQRVAGRRGSKVVPCASRNLAEWMISIARRAHADLPLADALRSTVRTIWPRSPGKTIDFLNRNILFFLKDDRPFAAERSRRSMSRVGGLLATCATLETLTSLYPGTAVNSGQLRDELVTRRLGAIIVERPDLQPQVALCVEWSPIAQEVLRRTGAVAVATAPREASP